LYEQMNQFDLELKACQEAVHLAPQSPDSWGCLGGAYLDSARYPEAEKAFQEALKLDPNEVVNWLGLGRAFAEERKELGVLRVYDQLKRLDTNYADQFFRTFVRPILEKPQN